MPGTINGWTIAYTAVGGLVMWSGIAGTSLSATVKGALAGQSPTQVAQAEGLNAPATAAAAGNTGAANAGAAANQAIARVLAAPYGWSAGQQWADLVSLWNQESGWNSTAQNPTSTAYGIAQFLDTTWAPYGAKTPDAALQIRYGLEYIKDRYGSPGAAWAHEESAGWY